MKTIPIKQIPNIVTRINFLIKDWPGKNYRQFLEKHLLIPIYIPKWKVYQAEVAGTDLYYANIIWLSDRWQDREYILEMF